MTVEIALIIVCTILLFTVWCLLGILVLLRDVVGHKMGVVGKILCAPILGFAWIALKLTS